MSIISKVSDFIKDRFGIMDDINDFEVFISEAGSRFNSRLDLANKTLSNAVTLVQSATSLKELKDVNSRVVQITGIVDSLISDLRNIYNRTKSVLSLAEKNKVVPVIPVLSNTIKQQLADINKLVLAKSRLQDIKKEQEYSLSILEGKEINEKLKQSFYNRLSFVLGLLSGIGYVTINIARYVSGSWPG